MILQSELDYILFAPYKLPIVFLNIIFSSSSYLFLVVWLDEIL